MATKKTTAGKKAPKKRAAKKAAKKVARKPRATKEEMDLRAHVDRLGMHVIGLVEREAGYEECILGQQRKIDDLRTEVGLLKRALVSSVDTSGHLAALV